MEILQMDNGALVVAYEDTVKVIFGDMCYSTLPKEYAMNATHLYDFNFDPILGSRYEVKGLRQLDGCVLEYHGVRANHDVQWGLVRDGKVLRDIYTHPTELNGVEFARTFGGYVVGATYRLPNAITGTFEGLNPNGGFAFKEVKSGRIHYLNKMELRLQPLLRV